MTNLSFISIIFLMALLHQNYDVNLQEYSPNTESEKCYVECAKPITTAEIELAVYTGDAKSKTVELRSMELLIGPSTPKWVKKKSDNCTSSNPKDCIIWCLVEMPTLEEVKIVVDTKQTENFYIHKVSADELMEMGCDFVWKTALCEANITSDIVQQVQNVLRTEGYYKGEGSGLLDKKTKRALIKFQKRNGAE
mgnify:CR=1 FL=1